MIPAVRRLIELKDNQPTMRAKAGLLLSTECDKQPHAQKCTDYGDRIEWRQLWARTTDPEATGLYGASQVYVDESECNGQKLLKTFRGHWTVEAKNHCRRDVT